MSKEIIKQAEESIKKELEQYKVDEVAKLLNEEKDANKRLIEIPKEIEKICKLTEKPQETRSFWSLN